MLYFASDYQEGCCPEILEKLGEINLAHHIGYGKDSLCEKARQTIRKVCDCPDVPVHFLTGGTQANSTVISALLRQYQGVLAAETGHIAGHEAGAVEYTGHKVLCLPPVQGKVSAASVCSYMKAFLANDTNDHMVEPGMVYISHPTECGTLYTREELTELHKVCRSYHLPLFLDGARLGYGLAAPGTDVTLEDVASLTDAFTIGGTKVGALFGEAVVFPTPSLGDHFFTITKEHGALLAKGWLLGLQFEVLFTDNLYLRIAKHADDMAMLLKKGLAQKGYAFHPETFTNQQFPVMDDATLNELSRRVVYSMWEPLQGGKSVIRLATSWATTEAEVQELLASL
ncbi:MAG: beta-eliminating lyase-related protein [Sphaerochaetaceae bacterium]|jgi:threonine aldolase